VNAYTGKDGDRCNYKAVNYKRWVKERYHLGDPGVCRRIILKYIFRKWVVGVWNRSSWLRTGTGGGHL
jgi:hypothetical protein